MAGIVVGMSKIRGGEGFETVAGGHHRHQISLQKMKNYRNVADSSIDLSAISFCLLDQSRVDG